jgi:hypothetical protein
VIGDALRSRTEGWQTTEVAIAVASLNRMLKLGRPEYGLEPPSRKPNVRGRPAFKPFCHQNVTYRLA